MLNEAIWRSKQTPGHKYNMEKRTAITPKSRGALMYPRERLKGQSIKGSRATAHIIPKEKIKTLGAYESTKAIVKT